MTDMPEEAVYSDNGYSGSKRCITPARSTTTVKSTAGKPKAVRGTIMPIEEVFGDADNRRNTEVARK